MAVTDHGGRAGQHFREEDWVDFARQQPSPEQARLQQHAAVCGRCARSVRLWSAMARFATEEASYEPPPEALRQARGRFCVERPSRPIGRAARAARLLYDSLWHPLPSGVRASAPSARQMLFRAGPYVVKLRMEEAATGRTSIVGQIHDEQEPASPLHDVAVLAAGGRKTLDRTVTNEWGEFLLEPEAAERLQLALALPRIGTFSVQLRRTARTSRRRGAGVSGGSRGRRRRGRAGAAQARSVKK
jgi:hypothetical protein